ncbi:L-ascorbate oxidase [Tanacetum coccineum]
MKCAVLDPRILTDAIRAELVFFLLLGVFHTINSPMDLLLFINFHFLLVTHSLILRYRAERSSLTLHCVHLEFLNKDNFRGSLFFVPGKEMSLKCNNLTTDDRNFKWVVTYGTVSPLGVPQRGILINGMFPGPTIECETNDNVIVEVVNNLDEPFLITWNGVKQRKTSWQDGVLGTNCPIPAHSSWTYHMQVKDQIGTFSYFPSIGMHRAAGGYGGFNIGARPVIFVPYLKPVAEFTVLVSDWWKSDHKALRQILDSGKSLPKPNALLINGSPRATSFTGQAGQRWNLTANAARPNPQGAFHFGTIPITRTVILANSKAKIGGKLRYAVNKVSHIDPGTPLKVADYLNIPGVFKLDSIKPTPSAGPAVLAPSVMGFVLHDFVEIIFQNNENCIQSWHLDGHDFWSVGFGGGQWNSTLRKRFYNLNDATSRYTVQVYPKSWSSILASLDNKGMWNLRSANWPRQYLGQQLYARVWNDEKSLYTEYDIPANALRCGKFH